MPAKPWPTFGAPNPDANSLALLSCLPLKSFARVLPFMFYTAQVINQLSAAPGLLGYSLLARPLSKKFWTLSAWDTDADLHAFVRHPPRVRIVIALAPHVAKTEFICWPVKASQLPLQWEDALARFHNRSLK